jgi:hypothetical protein
MALLALGVLAAACGSSTSANAPTATTAPPSLTFATIASDGSTPLLFGGLTGEAVPNPHVWAWSSGSWSVVPTADSHGWGGSAQPYTGAFDASKLVLVAIAELARGYSTWTWRGGSWRPSPSGALAKEPVDGSVFTVEGLVYDAQVGSDVLVGCSLGSPTASTSVWRWSAGGWSEMAASQSGPCALHVGMAFDPSSKSLLVVSSGITWQWNSHEWSTLTPAVQPPHLSDFAMTADPSTNSIVLFGGLNDQLPASLSSATWLWSGSTWASAPATGSPPALHYPASGYDDASGKVILYGGSTSTGPSSKTWIWNGVHWGLAAS